MEDKNVCTWCRENIIEDLTDKKRNYFWVCEACHYMEMTCYNSKCVDISVMEAVVHECNTDDNPDMIIKVNGSFGYYTFKKFFV